MSDKWMDVADVSLDDIIQMQKNKKGGTGKQAQRRHNNNHHGNSGKSNPNHQFKRHGQNFKSSPPGAQQTSPPVLNSPKLLVSSLASSVTADDLEELFSEFGQLQCYPLMHFDARGKPLGSAEITFSKRGDAKKALDKYNGVHLDGAKMKIQFVQGQSISERVVLPKRPLQQQGPQGGNFSEGYQSAGQHGHQQQQQQQHRFKWDRNPAGTLKGKKGGWADKDSIDPDQLDKEMDTYMMSHPNSAMM